MQSKTWLFVVLVAVLFSDILADDTTPKPRKLKKYKKTKPAAAAALDSKDEIQVIANDEEDKSVESDDLPPPIHKDPCSTKHCGAGRVCQVTDQGLPVCACVPYCSTETDPRRKVCSNHNETWGSDCELFQMRCWCDHKDERCRGEQYEHLHIDYYGVCKNMQECEESEMLDFPRRMRDWLFNIMRDMADRSELTPHYMELEKEAESNMTRRWTNAAIWKWCDLDGHPHDRSVSRHELFPIRAPLMTLEHCIAPFLNSCDADDDHRITLQEWGKCLELPAEELEDKCEEIREEEARD